MLKASIDLGTNTCLLLIADCDSATGEVKRVRHDQSTMVRLGQGVDRTRRIHPDAADRTLKCLRGYAAQAASAGVKPSEIVAVATATARDAENGPEFFAQVERETGIRFRTISGEAEARAMFVGGLLPGMDPGTAVVIDIGGGSTEFNSARGAVSFQMGSVRFTERYLKSDPVADEEFWACREAVEAELARAGAFRAVPGAALVGVAGTVVTLAQWHLGLKAFDAAAIDGCVLARGDLHRMVEELKWRTIAERQAIEGVEAGRADVLLAGALILWRTLEALGYPALTVSTRGLRYGVIGLAPEARSRT